MLLCFDIQNRINDRQNYYILPPNRFGISGLGGKNAINFQRRPRTVSLYRNTDDFADITDLKKWIF